MIQMKSKPVSTDVAIIPLCLSLRCFYRSRVLSRTEEATACFTLLVPKHTHTHTPLRSHQKASGMGEWVCEDLCDLLLWASHRGISTRKQYPKTQTHTNISSGYTQDHWQAVIDWMCICVSLEKGHIVWMSVLMWISHTQHGGLIWRDLKMLVLCAVCVYVCAYTRYFL